MSQKTSSSSRSASSWKEKKMLIYVFKIYFWIYWFLITLDQIWRYWGVQVALYAMWHKSVLLYALFGLLYFGDAGSVCDAVCLYWKIWIRNNNKIKKYNVIIIKWYSLQQSFTGMTNTRHTHTSWPKCHSKTDMLSQLHHRDIRNETDYKIKHKTWALVLGATHRLFCIQHTWETLITLD